MIYLRVRTDNLFRVVRKFETRNARLLAILSVDEPLSYHLYYAVENNHSELMPEPGKGQISPH